MKGAQQHSQSAAKQIAVLLLCAITRQKNVLHYVHFASTHHQHFPFTQHNPNPKYSKRYPIKSTSAHTNT